MAHAFPDLRSVGGHIGVPWGAEMISLLMKPPNVAVDTSAYQCTRFPADLVASLRGPGRGQVLFGTNDPMLTPAACLAGLDRLALGADVQAAFLAGHARRAFELDQAPGPAGRADGHPGLGTGDRGRRTRRGRTPPARPGDRISRAVRPAR